MGTLNWTTADSEGSLVTRGKNDYYAILVKGIPEERPKDCIIELYATTKEMTISEIKFNPNNEPIKLLSRLIVLGRLSPAYDIEKGIEEMKDTAERKENENPYGSINSAYTSK